MFFHKVAFGSKSLSSFSIDNKSLIQSALVTWKEAQIPNFGHFLKRFLVFFKLSVLEQAFDLVQWFSYKNLIQSMYFAYN